MRPDPVEQALADTRTRLTKSEEERGQQARAYRPRVLYSNPAGKNHPWWYTNACARIGRILEGARPTFGAFSRDYALESACLTAGHPKLARRYIELWGYFQTRDKPAPVKGQDHNPFRYMSDRDAYKRWYAEIERICEASVGKFGDWRNGVATEIGVQR